MRRTIFFIFIFSCLSLAALTVFAASQILVTVSINPLGVSADASKNVRVGKIFTLKARIENDGSAEIKNVTAELFVPQGIISLNGDPIQNIGKISGKRHKDVHWKLKAAAIGQYIATVRVQGINGAGESVSNEDSLIINVIKSRGFNWFFWNI